MPLVLFISLLLSCLSFSLAFVPKFRDVTAQSGIDLLPEGPDKPRLQKYGGPTVADLDGDGYYDLIFVHHGPESPEVYFSKRDGTFAKSSFRSRRDNHAFTPFRLPKIRDRFFTQVPGGNNGVRPNFPVVYRVSKERKITKVTEKLGVDVYTAKGRSAVFMPLQTKTKNPDVVFLNDDSRRIFCSGCTDGQYDPYEYTGGNPVYKPRQLKNFRPSYGNAFGLAVDPDGDRQLELLTWRELSMHRVVGSFELKDISNQVFGGLAYAGGVAAVAEIDFDNDGDFDLYIARDKKGRRNDKAGATFPDLLLENRGGKYVNVAVKAGIPQDTISRGVTVGDFNNDRYMDIYVSVLRGKPDVLLLNNGDGTFRSINIGIGKNGASGDNAMAVDYNNDGRVDLIRSEGDWGLRDLGGQFRILKNVPKRKDRIGRWIKVRVGSIGLQTSQHAVVEVVAGGVRTVQRVGPAGASVSHSYFDTLHFGIWRSRRAFVTVTWLNGVKRTRRARAGQTITIGKY